ncbi:MAG: hypothetical protein J7M26_03405, partial [Armatimonadetes bacterium]|nr:hypothetical protein [Armatimonadota bacterium]
MRVSILKWHVVAAGIVVFVLGGQAFAQPLVLGVDHPRGLTKLEVANQVLLQDTNGDWWFTPAGRFKLYTGHDAPRGGNPTYSGDEDKRIASVAGPTGVDPTDAAYYGDWTSGIMLAVDPDDPDNGQIIDPFDLALQQSKDSNPANLTQYWIQDFSAGSRDASGTARVPIETDDSGNTTGWADMRVEYTLVGDALQVAVIVTNNGQQTHNIGLRVVFDAGFDQPATVNDGQPIFLPNGQVITGETVIQGPFDEETATWVAYDNPQAPLLGVRGFVGTSDTDELFNRGTATEAAGMPTQMEFGQLRNVGLGVWNFLPNAGAPILGVDWGYAVKWEAEALAPGHSRRYVTWYGVGTSSPSYDFPFALMGYVPLRLQAVQDPGTGQYQIVDLFGQYPIPVSLYVDNYGPSPLLNASVKVRLPAGFELDSGSPVANLGIIPHDELDSYTWPVVATATRPGRADFKFTGPGGRSVIGEVSIPVLPILNPLPASQPAFEMVSFPYAFANNSARHVLASLGDLSPGGPATIVRYDPLEANATVRYKFYPDPLAATIVPGAGYWLLNLNRLPIVLPDDRSAIGSDIAYNVVTYRGWNQIGNPFQYTIDFMTIEVIDSSNRRWTMQEAIDRQLVLPTLFSWDPLNRQYVWEVDPYDVHMDPYMGYWFKANDNLVLLVPPPVFQWTASVKKASGGHRQEPVPGWRFGLTIGTEKARAERLEMGAAPGASVGWDRWDLPRPPEPAALREPRVRAAAIGPEGCPCLTDIRPDGQARYEWEISVVTNEPGAQVTVRWPDLRNLPPTLLPTLVDEESGARRYMRTTSAYSFTSSPVGAPRKLKVVVQRRTSTTPMVTAAHVQPQRRGAEIVYTLSAPAEVEVTVRNIAGRCIR